MNILPDDLYLKPIYDNQLNCVGRITAMTAACDNAIELYFVVELEERTPDQQKQYILMPTDVLENLSNNCFYYPHARAFLDDVVTRVTTEEICEYSIETQVEDELMPTMLDTFESDYEEALHASKAEARQRLSCSTTTAA